MNYPFILLAGITIGLMACKKDVPVVNGVEPDECAVFCDSKAGENTYLLNRTTKEVYEYDTEGNLLQYEQLEGAEEFGARLKTYEYVEGEIRKVKIDNYFSATYLPTATPDSLTLITSGTFINNSVALFDEDKLANWWLGISEANFYYSEIGLLDSIDNGIIGHKSYFEYSEGKLIKMRKKIPTDITIEMIFEYDEKGNWIGVQEYDDGALRFTLSYTYDEVGYLTSSLFTMGSTAEINYYCQCGDQNLRELNPINFFQHPIYYLSNGHNSYSFIGR